MTAVEHGHYALPYQRVQRKPKDLSQFGTQAHVSGEFLLFVKPERCLECSITDVSASAHVQFLRASHSHAKGRSVPVCVGQYYGSRSVPHSLAQEQGFGSLARPENELHSVIGSHVDVSYFLFDLERQLICLGSATFSVWEIDIRPI